MVGRRTEEGENRTRADARAVRKVLGAEEVREL